MNTLGTSLFESKSQELGVGIHKTTYEYFTITIGVVRSNHKSYRGLSVELLLDKAHLIIKWLLEIL